ncbi:MAG: TIGR02530 family flagellar biosynthesis protein [Bacteriovoracia bacterium]
MSGPILYPNVTSLNSQTGRVEAERGQRIGGKTEKAVPGEFDAVFRNEIGKDAAKDLSKIREPLKFSAHANQRLNDRKISMDPALMEKINGAIDKAAAKGIDDTLVITSDAAFIVNVPNRTVVTAMDKNSLNGNVFTNIDGAVIV